MDVLIAGAGPTGLLLAGDLARAGVPVTVLERRARESNLSRAFAVHARTLEVLDARGVADELISTGHRLDRLALFDPVALDLSRRHGRCAQRGPPGARPAVPRAFGAALGHARRRAADRVPAGYPAGRRVPGGLRVHRAVRRRLEPAAAGPGHRPGGLGISGIGISYRPSEPGAHPLAGRRMPDVPLAAGRGRLYEVLRGGKFALLSATDRPPRAAAWEDRIDVVTPACQQPPLVLVRPDEYVAWAAGQTDPAHRDAALWQALTRWCGSPARDHLTQAPQNG